MSIKQFVINQSQFNSNNIIISLFLISIGFALIIVPKAHALTFAQQCTADFNNNTGVVYGYAEFVPSSLTLGTTQVKNITLRTHVCNATRSSLYDVKDYYGASKVQQNGQTGVITYNPPGTTPVPIVNGYAQVDIGGFSPGQSKQRDITVAVHGNKFGSFVGCKAFTVLIHGYGVVYTTPTQFGQTNAADSGFNLTVCHNPPTISVTSSATADCTAIKGFAQDPDSPSTQLQIEFFIDGVQKIPPPNLFTSGSGHTFTINTVPYEDTSSHTFKVVALGVDPSGVQDGQNQPLTVTNVGPCLTISCSLSTSPANPEAGTAFDVTLTINYPAGLNTDPATFSMTNSGGLSFPTADAKVAGVNSFSKTYHSSAGGAGPGIYTITWTWTYSSGTFTSNSDCNKITLYNIPYVSVFGGDAVVGASYDIGSPNSCSSGVVSNITTEYDYGHKKGSGAQYRAQATDQISGFPSAFAKTGAASFGTGLSFTNDLASGAFINPAGDLFGGNFDQTECIPDWYVEPPSGTTVDSTTTNLDLSSLASGTYYYAPSPGDGTGNLEIGNALPSGVNTTSIAKGKRLVIYVNGNVSIDNNIVYAGANGGIGGWSSLADIPSVYIIVKGNIYIYSEVTQMDGVYIAQQADTTTGNNSAGNKGWIYTCARNTGSPYGPFDGGHYEVYDSLGGGNGRCAGFQLVVNGAIIGQRFKLVRTGSSLRFGSSSETPTSSNKNCSFKTSSPPADLQPTCAAEVFNYTPEVFLASPFSPNNTQLSSINDLPPVL